jgi:hypothetical protein
MSIVKATQLATDILTSVKLPATHPQAEELKVILLDWIYNKEKHIIDIIIEVIILLGLDYTTAFKTVYKVFKIWSATNIV